MGQLDPLKDSQVPSASAQNPAAASTLPGPAPPGAVLTSPLRPQAILEALPIHYCWHVPRTPHFRAFGLAALSALAFSPPFLHGQLLTPSSGLCSNISDTPAPAQWKHQAPPFQPVLSATLLYFSTSCRKISPPVWHLLHTQWMFPEWMNTHIWIREWKKWINISDITSQMLNKIPQPLVPSEFFSTSMDHFDHKQKTSGRTTGACNLTGFPPWFTKKKNNNK